MDWQSFAIKMTCSNLDSLKHDMRKILLLVDRLLPDVDGRLVQLALLLRRRLLGGGRRLVVQYWHALRLMEKHNLDLGRAE